MPLLIPTHREPTHPGAMLQKEFLTPLGMTPQDLAAAIFAPPSEIAELVNRQRGITTELALRLAKYFATSVGFWLNGQRVWEIYHAQRAEAEVLNQIQPLAPAAAVVAREGYYGQRQGVPEGEEVAAG